MEQVIPYPEWAARGFSVVANPNFITYSSPCKSATVDEGM